MGYQQGGIKANKYLYQGKEFQDGLNLNLYDFHARGYDPAIGRTMQMDPHAENYLELSPYSWVANNPISIIDPTGMDTVNYNNVDWKNFKTDTDVLGLDEVVFTFGSGNYPSLSDINGQNQKAMSGWGGGEDMNSSISQGTAVVGFMTGSLELSLEMGANQKFKYGQTINGKWRSNEVVSRVNKINLNNAAKFVGYAGKLLGVYGVLDSGLKLANDLSNLANWVKFGGSGAMLLLKTNPYTLVAGVGLTVLDESGYIDEWVGK